MEVVFLRGAEADLLAAWMRYEEILPGLGERFEVEVRAALFRTVELPESRLFTLENSGDCWCEGLTMEFSTAFTALALVTAVLDLRQDPSTIRGPLNL